MKKRLRLLAICLLFAAPLSSLDDFLDYWTVKRNGIVIYDSSKDHRESNFDGEFKFFKFQVAKSKLLPTDSLEFEYFTDTPCPTCVHTYFITEYTGMKGEAYESLNSYLKEAKSFGPKSFRISLLDILNCGEKESIKAVFFCTQCHSGSKELCRISFN